jgi:hypothetical protein
MARATNLGFRRGYQIDAETIVVGAVGAGTKGRAAATRTGSALLLTTLLNRTDDFRAVFTGQSSSSAGGYLLQFAHVPMSGVLADAAGWTTLATISVSGLNTSEAVLSGKQVHDAVRTAAITGAAVTVSVLNTNVVTLTIGAHTYQVGDYVTVSGMTSAGVPMNGTYAVTAIAATTISYAKTNANIADGGTAGLVYPGRAIALSTDEIRVAAVRAVAGTGSNGASAPAGTNTLYLATDA